MDCKRAGKKKKKKSNGKKFARKVFLEGRTEVYAYIQRRIKWIEYY